MTEFKEGQLIGPHRIVKVIKAQGCDDRCLCRCEHCGSEKIRTIGQMQNLVLRPSLRCNKCAAVVRAERSHRRMNSMRGCRRCEGLPHRRPEHGACDCGELYQAERIEVETFGYSAIALAQEMV